MKGVMIVGTTSHAGKSFLTTALCRLFSRQGFRVCPFKGQNMALNAYVTDSGGEIGYAQAVQAWAAKVSPTVDMNPILLKPQGNMTSQVIIKGAAVGVTTASDYYRDYFDRGWQTITASLDTLGAIYDVIVCEGAGSPAEINLKHRDLTNMRVAKYLNAPTILVVDIDRGGAFAHVVGTLALLDPEEVRLIKGIVINKFRGQKSLLDSGITWLEEYTGIPVIGILPWTDIPLPAEDSLSLFDQPGRKRSAELEVSVLRLPRIANFTDFDPLGAEASVKVKYVGLEESLGYPDAVIIPGSKTSIGDLGALYSSGMAERLRDYHASGGVIFGICGGYQMLGESISDPDGLEGEDRELKGLGLLPIHTVITADKVTGRRELMADYPEKGLPVEGYEIHNGKSTLGNTIDHHFLFNSDPTLGIVHKSFATWGCYLHGLFDNGAWRRGWLNCLRDRRGLPPLPTAIGNYAGQREIMLDAMADLVDSHLDLKPIVSGWQ
ncbi:MAG: Cobyric acid synthase [Chroococcopsis gigantea SAG 12.99]|jgi:adenosylcobyric acid synthase|nr:cobyric acid synthase CobQ [Chlorogloea purpurea SAG 13.99]MDV2998459.1 Cobyric acid synthase [Chroococcopsis gigantea SAG 12.99]